MGAITQENERSQQNILVGEITISSLLEARKTLETKIELLWRNRNLQKQQLEELESKHDKIESTRKQETVCAAMGSTMIACVAGVVGDWITKLPIIGHEVEIQQAQQEYTNQVVSDFQNQFGYSLIPNPDSIGSQIAVYSKYPYHDYQTSQNLAQYAYDVSTNLNQIAYDISGATDGTMFSVLCIAGTFGLVFSGCMIGSSIAKYSRKKKILGLHKNLQNTEKEKSELEAKRKEVVHACEQLKNSSARLCAEEQQEEQKQTINNVIPQAKNQITQSKEQEIGL